MAYSAHNIEHAPWRGRRRYVGYGGGSVWAIAPVDNKDGKAVAWNAVRTTNVEARPMTLQAHRLAEMSDKLGKLTD